VGKRDGMRGKSLAWYEFQGISVEGRHQEVNLEGTEGKEKQLS
jgi:hypothetical protein